MFPTYVIRGVGPNADGLPRGGAACWRLVYERRSCSFYETCCVSCIESGINPMINDYTYKSACHFFLIIVDEMSFLFRDEYIGDHG